MEDPPQKQGSTLVEHSASLILTSVDGTVAGLVPKVLPLSIAEWLTPVFRGVAFFHVNLKLPNKRA